MFSDKVCQGCVQIGHFSPGIDEGRGSVSLNLNLEEISVFVSPHRDNRFAIRERAVARVWSRIVIFTILGVRLRSVRHSLNISRRIMGDCLVGTDSPSGPVDHTTDTYYKLSDEADSGALTTPFWEGAWEVVPSSAEEPS